MRLSTITLVITLMTYATGAFATDCSEREQVRALALNMYHEARGDGLDSMQLVGEVTLNRVDNDNFPDNICEVVYQAKLDANGNPIRGKCQFSWYCDGRSDRPRDIESWTTSLFIAYGLVNGTIDLLGIEATHYHAKGVRPHWARHYKRLGYYGNHVFYRMGRNL